jgi:hypothetical protein
MRFISPSAAKLMRIYSSVSEGRPPFRAVRGRFGPDGTMAAGLYNLCPRSAPEYRAVSVGYVRCTWEEHYRENKRNR